MPLMPSSAPPPSQPQQQAFDHLLRLCKDFDDIHKHFLQLMLKRRHIDVSRIGQICLEICNQIDQGYKNNLRALKKLTFEQNNQTINALREVINTRISPLGMYIVQLTDEFARGLDYWVLFSEVHFSSGLLHASLFNNDEAAMFHHWLKLMFFEYQAEEEEDHDSATDDIMDPNEPKEKTSGELSLSKALNYAKKKGWTMQKAQKLLDKIERQPRWFRVIKGDHKSRGGRRSTLANMHQSVIRLTPHAVAELEPLLRQLHVPTCVLCKHPAVVSRLAYTCEECQSTYHASCMLRILEFPAECNGEDCEAMLEEELMEEFEFDTDRLCIRPKISRASANQSHNDSTRQNGSADAANQRFLSLRY